MVYSSTVVPEYDGDDGGVDYDLNYLPPYSWPFYTAIDRVNYAFFRTEMSRFSMADSIIRWLEETK